MTRILMLVAIGLLFAASPANAQYVRGPVGGAAFIFPSGTTAWSIGPNAVQSPYFYVPPVNYNGVPNYWQSYNYPSNRRRGYYVAPNANGGGGYYSTVPSYYYRPNR